ncbi:response regulator transcription factor [Trichlorobacter lovleyi]|uniref:Two component transcriptional regulator, winged helix family n=1 Tax=Trichlorobacter lovleyi (strain ATCC BAA-1151 / DSM 17278 / SZ) TaxID=398767 RepID=B3E8G4_TRIL1|nr:response regulator transcription factor [Trichlorobacter lovleyi]ACD96640.1 two component transcriptional regulator, winged helix family [Trichlorobacter lovleyi SZ]
MQPPILIVEDDLKIARIIKAYLEGADFRVIHADTARAALEKAEAELPLAVILDLGLPDKSGEELCQELKDLGSFPVIMLTAKSSEEERITGFALGADDYVVKPASPRELVYRVKAVLKRYDGAGAGEHPISFNNGTLILDSRRHTVTCRGESCSVTPTEFKLLQALAASPGRTYSRDELVSKALGYQFDGYERSVDAHIKNLRQKIELDSRKPEFIKTVYGIGYLFSGERDAV